MSSPSDPASAVPAIADAQRYLRQILLAEVGKEGQATLCAAKWAPDVTSSPEARAVTAMYLERAGVQVSGKPCRPTANARPMAGAEAALEGAFEAVEFIKAQLGVGTPGTLPPSIFEFGTQ